MRKFYKSYIFLLVLNGLLILPIFFFGEFKLLIPAFASILTLDLFLLLFPDFYLRKKIPLSSYVPKDPYGAQAIFETLKKKYGMPKARLFKPTNNPSSFFYFFSFEGPCVVLSEDILEKFPQKDIKYLLSYPFYFARSGDLLFLSLLSAFLWIMEKIARFLSYPLFRLFRPRKGLQKEPFFLVLILKILSLITKRIFYQADAHFTLSKEDKASLALLLWKLDSLVKVRPPKALPFTLPLFLIKALTSTGKGPYTSLQPLIKKRIRFLTGVYPP